MLPMAGCLLYLGKLNMRLDKTVFTRQSFAQAADHQCDYAKMSELERLSSFRHLMSAAYGLVGKDCPKMDKTVFQVRKRR